MIRLDRNPSHGKAWRRAILAAIALLAVFFSVMIVIRPFGSSGWLWAFALLLYVPFVLAGAAVLKYVILSAQQLFHHR